MQHLKSLIGLAAAFIIGVIPAFFINLNSVFSDRNGSLNEVLMIYMVLIISYFTLGFVSGFIGKHKAYICTIAISLPAIILLLLYSFREIQLLGQIMINILLTLGSTYLGAALSFKFSLKK